MGNSGPYALRDASGRVVGILMSAPTEALGDGVTAEPWVEGMVLDTAPIPVPTSVTNFQARAVMRAFIMPDGRSLETTVRDYLAAQRDAAAVLPEAAPARIAADSAWLAWEQSNDFQRNGALVTSLAPTFGLTPGDLDALFIQAVGVVA